MLFMSLSLSRRLWSEKLSLDCYQIGPTVAGFNPRTGPLMRQQRPFISPYTRVLNAGCAAGAMAIELVKASVQ